MFVIALLVIVAGGGLGYWLLTRSDELLRQAVVNKISEILPEWDIEVGRARFDWDRQVSIWNSKLKTGSRGAPLVHIPEITLTVDGEALSQDQQVIVQRVRLSGAQIELVRDAQGNWNWQDLPKLPESNLALPEFEIVRANVRVKLEHLTGPPTVLHISDADFRLVPSGKRRFIVQGLTQVDRAGRLDIQEGRWNLDEGTWSIQGEMRGVQAGADLIELIATASPELGDKLANLDRKLQSLGTGEPGNSAAVVRTAQKEPASRGSFAEPAAHSRPAGSAKDFGVQADLDVEFRVTRWQRTAEPEFTTTVTVQQGSISNPALPFPLRDVEGVIKWDNRRVLLRDVSANHGATRLRLNGSVERQGPRTPARFDVRIEQLTLDERLRSRLPESVRRMYDTIRPSGEVDGSVTLLHDHDGRGRWTYQDLVMTTRGGRCQPSKFPYPVHGITGKIDQQGNVLEIDVSGIAGRTPIRALGFAKNPGPEAEVRLTVSTAGLPIDETLRDALEPYPGIQRTFDLLRPEGRIQNVQATLIRPAGIGQKFQPDIDADLNNCSLNYEHFPYRLTELSGRLVYRSDAKICTFEDLKAKHHAATLRGHGYFSKQQEPGALWLVIDAENGQLDKSLERALPESLQSVWEELSPAGRIKRLTANIAWSPGSAPSVMVPNAEIDNAKFKLRSLPYPISEIQARFAFADGTGSNEPSRVAIKSFDGWHDETHVIASDSTVTVLPDGRWQLAVEKFNADDLVADQTFREALPPELRSVCESLNPRGPLSLSGWFRLWGSGLDDDQMRADWDVRTVFSNAQFTAGLELEKVSGDATSRGQWNGEHVQTVGEVDLGSVYLWGYRLTEVKGPYRLNNAQLTIGAGNAAATAPGMQRVSATSAGDNFTAKFVKGTLTLDAVATLEESPSYTVKAQLKNGDLEEYARLYMPGAGNLRGLMNGWAIVSQTRSRPMGGQGELLISPAALYELPVMAQVFKTLNSVLNSAPPDNTAFNYAYLSYNLDDAEMEFDRIDLVGDALSLRGKGKARYDGQLGLTFYSRLPRSRLLPRAIGNILGDATQGWMAIEVTGRTNAPQARYVAAPVLNDSLNRLLKAFDPTQPVPGLKVPQFFPPPGQWGPGQWGIRPVAPPLRQ